MNSRKRDARIAGVLYLLMGIASVVSLSNVPTWLTPTADAAAVANRITTSQLSYRVGVLADVVGQILSVFAILALYHLLQEVNRRHALAMLALGLVG